MNNPPNPSSAIAPPTGSGTTTTGVPLRSLSMLITHVDPQPMLRSHSKADSPSPDGAEATSFNVYALLLLEMLLSKSGDAAVFDAPYSDGLGLTTTWASPPLPTSVAVFPPVIVTTCPLVEPPRLKLVYSNR